jgi:hypothetical protein
MMTFAPPGFGHFGGKFVSKKTSGNFHPADEPRLMNREAPQAADFYTAQGLGAAAGGQ